MSIKYLYLLLVSVFSWQLNAQPLFDSHIHYSSEQAKRLSPKAVLQQLDKNAIRYAAVISAPSEYANELYKLAPERIVPVLSIYRDDKDKANWVHDETVIQHLNKELERGYWQGIGELHIFASDRHSEVFEKIIALASAKQLPLLLHADPAVIDRLYEIAPEQPVLWAHSGTYPYPDLVADYLRRYTNLSIDVSMRDERIAPDGVIADDWYQLFVSYPDRIMIGVDTYSDARWREYESAVITIRNWLAQLPDEVTLQLAVNNAARLYKKPLSIKAE